MDGIERSDPLIAWVFLSLLPATGPVFWQRWLDRHLSPLSLLDPEQATGPGRSLPSQTASALTAWHRDDRGHPLMQRLSKVLRQIAEHGIEVVTWEDPRYPALLREIHGPPIVLFVRGDISALTKRQVALVGSRKASRDGHKTAHQLAADLVSKGLAVTSGLALGVDAAAHQGALSAGGPTVAVLGTGLAPVYPRQHASLAELIVDNGCLVSEMPPGTPAKPGYFPRRNRIISGLCDGVVVVEAGLRSGSLITARLGLEQGREVFAVPGSIYNPQVRGCHRLLREGARLVETGEDIVEELSCGWYSEAANTAAGQQPLAGLDDPPELSGDEARVYEALGFAPSHSDELAERTGLPADQLMQALLMLEMEGHAESVAGGYRRAC